MINIRETYVKRGFYYVCETHRVSFNSFHVREVTYDKRIFSIRKTNVAHFAVYLGKMIGKISEKPIYI